MCDEDDAPSDCKVKTRGDRTTLYASASPDIFGIDEDMTKEAVIELMEDDGFTCK